MAHDHRKTYSLTLHGLSVYPGHHEHIAAEILAGVELPPDLTVQFAAADAADSYWRAIMVAYAEWMREEQKKGCATLPKGLGAATAAVVLSSIGALATQKLWQPYYIDERVKIARRLARRQED